MKIGWGQLLMLLLLGRIFTLMTYVPYALDGYSMSAQMIGIIISTVIQVGFILPIIFINKNTPSKNIPEIAKEKNIILGVVITVLYLIIILVAGVFAVCNFEEFISNVFFPFSSKIIGIITLVGVCIYAAYLGIEGIARFGAIVLAVFTLMLIYLLMSSFGQADLMNYQPNFMVTSDGVLKAAVDDLSKCSELFVIGLLMKYIKNNNDFRKSVFSFFAGKIVILEVISFLIITILGNYARFVEYPFFSLNNYSNVYLIERLDAVYLIVWTLTAVLNVSVIIFLSGELFKNMFPKGKGLNLISGVIIVGGSLPVILGSGMVNEIYKKMLGVLSLVILILIIPLFLYLITRKRGGSNDKSIKESDCHIGVADNM